MDKKHFEALDGYSYTYTPTETKEHEISVTRVVEYEVTGGYGGSRPNGSGCGGGMKVVFTVSEQRFGFRQFERNSNDLMPAKVVKQLVNLDIGQCPIGMEPLMREVVDEAVAELGIDTSAFLLAHRRGDLPWPSLGELVTTMYVVQNSRYKVEPEFTDREYVNGEMTFREFEEAAIL